MNIEFTKHSIGDHVVVRATADDSGEHADQIIFDVRIRRSERDRSLEWVCSNLSRENATALRDRLTELLEG